MANLKDNETAGEDPYTAQKLTPANAQKYRAVLEMVINEYQLNQSSVFPAILKKSSPFYGAQSYVKIPFAAFKAKGVEPADVSRIITGLNLIDFDLHLSFENSKIKLQQTKEGKNDFHLQPADIGRVAIISVRNQDSIRKSKGILGEIEQKLESGNGKLTKHNREKIQQKFPIKLLPDAKWEHLTIKFVDGHIVDILYKGKKVRTDFNEMGFRNEITGKPNLMWQMFEGLSHHNGETNRDFFNKLNEKQRNQIKSQKKQLAESLKTYFGLKEDPLPFSFKDRCYRLRLHLVPSGGKVSRSAYPTEDDDILEGMPDLR